jgi:hypothetical protein
MPEVQTATKLRFDVAADLLSARREFAVRVTKVLWRAPTTSRTRIMASKST